MTCATRLAPTTLDPSRTGGEVERLQHQLRGLIVGQDGAIRAIVNAYQLHLTGMAAPDRPIGNFLFLGPTGCGKTRIVEAAAECLVGSSKAVIKIDCAEFQHSHEIAKLLGSPPGYLGHRETQALLSQESINRGHTESVKISFVLFDEIEKASDALWNLLLGILDKAALTLGDNRKVDFSRTLIFMTGNIGSAEMNALLSPRVGFDAGQQRRKAHSGEIEESLEGRMSRTSIEAARRKFSPEFINRLDNIVVFKPLGTIELLKIVDIELKALQQRIFRAPSGRAFLFTVTESGKQFLLKEGTDARYGARHLKRAIERSIVAPLSNLIATDQIRTGDHIGIDHEPSYSEMTFRRLEEGLPLQEMAQVALHEDLLAKAQVNAVTYKPVLVHNGLSPKKF